MRSNEYRFVTHWRVEATAEEVFDLLDNALDLPRWWPAVYLDVKEVEQGAIESPHERMAAVYAPVAAAPDEDGSSARVFARSLGRFRGYGGVDFRPGRAICRYCLRLASQGRETVAAVSVVSVEANLFGESPVGDGAG